MATPNKKQKEADKATAMIRRRSSKPNVPCFDYDPKTGKPNLLANEKVAKEEEVKGITVLETNLGRRIFLCSLDDYESNIGVLADRKVYEAWNPHAIDGPAKVEKPNTAPNTQGPGAGNAGGNS